MAFHSSDSSEAPCVAAPLSHRSLILLRSGGCEENVGRDQPCVVVAGNWKGKCLVNRWKPTCSGGHTSSRLVFSHAS